MAAAQSRASMPPITTTAVPTAKKASELAGAKGKLVVTPPSSGNLSGSLRKPTGSLTMGKLRKPTGKTMNTKMLLKKPSGGANVKLGVNKLSTVSKNGNDKMTGFDEMEEKASQPAPAPKVVPVATAPVVAVVSPAKKEPEKPKPTLQDGVTRMQNMNQDFFSGV